MPKKKVPAAQPKSREVVQRAASLTDETTRAPDAHLLASDPLRGEPNAARARLPFDFPGYLTVWRLMEKDRADELYHKGEGRYGVPLSALVGWTVELDLFTNGVKVFVRVGRDGTVKVFAEDSEGMTKLEEWQK